MTQLMDKPSQADSKRKCMTSQSILAIMDGKKTQFRVPLSHQPRSEDGQDWRMSTGGRRTRTNNIRTVVINKETGERSSADSFIDVYEWLGELSQFKVGQKIVIKEGWAISQCAKEEEKEKWQWQGYRIFYKADGAMKYIDPFGKFHDVSEHDGGPAYVNPGKWRSGMHMPDWASRLEIEITNVRVQRIHDISDDDIEAEGVSHWLKSGGQVWSPRNGFDGVQRDENDELLLKPNRVVFCSYWNEHYGHSSRDWYENPFVYAYDFKVTRRY